MQFQFWLACWLSVMLVASVQADKITIFQGPYHLSVGPEAYHLVRKKDGGSRQKGVLGGVAGCFERWRPNGFYWGVEGSCASGRLRGHTPRGAKIVSRLTEKQIEGRLGYNITADSNRFELVPFVSGGKYECENKFFPPSPMPTTFTDRFDFVGIGFYLVGRLTDSFSYGLMFQGHYSLNAWNEMTGDPGFEDVQTRINSAWQYQIELPLTYGVGCDSWALQVVPFYYYRHFGGMEAFPLDFIDTRFAICGVRLTLVKFF